MIFLCDFFIRIIKKSYDRTYSMYVKFSFFVVICFPSSQIWLGELVLGNIQIISFYAEYDYSATHVVYNHVIFYQIRNSIIVVNIIAKKKKRNERNYYLLLCFQHEWFFHMLISKLKSCFRSILVSGMALCLYYSSIC